MSLDYPLPLMQRSFPLASAWARLRLPVPLALLLAAVALIGITWALLVPPWQAPDETTHFAYVQSLVAHHALPGAKGRSEYSTSQAVGDGTVGASQGAFYPQTSPPSWSAGAFRRYEAAASSYLSSNGGGPNAESANPPLYYVYAGIGYSLDPGGNAFGRLYAIRIWGVPLLLASTLAAWLLAGEILGRRRMAQLVCASVVALMPMMTFMSTAVNVDALLICLWTWALWLGVRVIERGARRADAIALCAVTAAAVLTKATSYALIVPVLVALGLGWRRRPATERRGAATDVALALAALVAPVVAWLAATVALNRPAVNQIPRTAAAQPFNVTQLLSYVWQFYLPRLPFMRRFRETPGLSVYYIWIREAWGAFGWIDVVFPKWAYKVLGAITAVIAVSTAVVVGRRLTITRRWQPTAFLALTALALLALLHVSDYRSLIAGQGLLVQGRYLLPVVGLFGLSVALLVTRAPVRWQPAACTIVLVGLLVLQALSLSTVVHAYYL